MKVFLIANIFAVLLSSCLCDEHYKRRGGYTGGLVDVISGGGGGSTQVKVARESSKRIAIVGGGSAPGTVIQVGGAGGNDGYDEYGQPIVVATGGAGGNAGGRVIIQNKYGPGRRCADFDRECSATKFDRFPGIKFTYNFDLNNCVEIEVCGRCGGFFGADDNIFDNFNDCMAACD